jgi:hypothetical protein
MVTRRSFLKSAVVGVGGILTGVGVVQTVRLVGAPRPPEGTPLPDFDEDFEGLGSEWFLFGGADPTSTTLDGRIGDSRVHLGSGMAIHRARVPQPPFMVTAFCSSLAFDDIDAEYGCAGLAIGGASPKEPPGPDFYALQWDIAFLGEIGIIDGRWPGYAGDNQHLGTYVKLGDGDRYQVPLFLRMVVHAADEVDTYYGLDGERWTSYGVGIDPGVDVGAVLLLSYGGETTWDWVRFRSL